MNETSRFPDTNPTAQPDRNKVEKLLLEIQAQQSPVRGFIGGLIAAFIGAILWAAVTAITHYQIGFIAMAVGILVGYGVRLMGKGLDTIFGVIGGGLALFGCALGNLLAVLVSAAIQEDVSVFTILPYITPDLIAEIYRETFTPMDLLFYGIAIYEGYRFSFRRLSGAEIAAVS
mgnify:CR=1 FL=1